MSLRLQGKNAVVTGGTSGIGFETAQRFLAEGAQVLITGRAQDRVDAAVARLGSGASGVAADSRRIADLERLAQTAKSTFSQVDILFANAGGGIFSPIADTGEAAFDDQFDANVKGVFFTVQNILPLMGSGGSIILNASAVNAKGAPGGSMYFASKAAVRSFARSMAAELGGAGIRVNALSPGMIPTKFFENSNIGADGYAQFEQIVIPATPLGRPGAPREIANAAVFLASDEAGYITAADLAVDGGWMNV